MGSQARRQLVLLDDGIARLALLAVAERDVQRLLDLSVARIAATLAADHVQVFELLPDDVTLVVRSAFDGDRRALTRVRIDRPGDSQAGYTLHAGSPVVVDDVRHETRFRASRAQRARGVVASISVPLASRRGRPYGVLEVGTRNRLAVPSELAADFIESAGHLLVPAVERARVEAACRFLAESQSRLVSAHDFRQSADALAEIAVPRLADWCCIDIVLPNGELECVAVAHTDSKAAPATRRLRARLKPDPAADAGVARVVRTGVTEFHSDLGSALSAMPRDASVLAQLAEAGGFRTAIVAPLAARGHVFGAVTLVGRRERRVFDRGDVLVADAFATHAGLALDDVRLFFGRDREAATPRRLAGATSGVVLLDPEVVVHNLLSAVTDERSRLIRIVESVVFASRLRSSDRPRSGEACDAVEAARSAIDTVQGSLSGRRTIELAPPSVRVAGASETIRRIVCCLVDNAVTYSPVGSSVAVTIAVDGTAARLTVEDEGVGIGEDEREVVFEKFRRGAGAQELRADGVGLGLYVCRELVDRLGGKVEISDCERGTAVHVELPLAVDADNGPTIGRKQGRHASGSGTVAA